jgi:hypothetical protein
MSWSKMLYPAAGWLEDAFRFSASPCCTTPPTCGTAARLGQIVPPAMRRDAQTFHGRPWNLPGPQPGQNVLNDHQQRLFRRGTVPAPECPPRIARNPARPPSLRGKPAGASAEKETLSDRSNSGHFTAQVDVTSALWRPAFRRVGGGDRRTLRTAACVPRSRSGPAQAEWRTPSFRPREPMKFSDRANQIAAQADPIMSSGIVDRQRSQARMKGVRKAKQADRPGQPIIEGHRDRLSA